jgi:hypothetical protein
LWRFGTANFNLWPYEEEPRMTRMRADKDERGEWPIREYPRHPRLDFFRRWPNAIAPLGQFGMTIAFRSVACFDTARRRLTIFLCALCG